MPPRIGPSIIRPAIDLAKEVAKNAPSTSGKARELPGSNGGVLNSLSSFASTGGGKKIPPPVPPRRRAALPGAGNETSLKTLGSNNPFRSSRSSFLSNAGSALLHEASPFASPAASAVMNYAANALSPSPLAGGGADDTMGQMRAQQQEMMQFQYQMTQMNNENTMRSSLMEESQSLTSALATTGNKGAENISKAAGGQ